MLPFLQMLHAQEQLQVFEEVNSSNTTVLVKTDTATESLSSGVPSSTILLESCKYYTCSASSKILIMVTGKSFR